jgi:uncharacterized membrane protein
LLLVATVIYAVGVFGVTIFGNVPLNEMLDKFNLQSATRDEVKYLRTMFEMPWNKLNLVRTVANIGSLVLVIIACLSSPVDQ